MEEYVVDQYTVSLLHFNNGITDETGKIWTANGGAATSGVQSKFGGESLFVGGGGYNYIATTRTSELDFGNSDFTIEMWVYPTASLATNTYLYATNTLSLYQGVAIFGTGTTVNASVSTNGSSWVNASCNGLIIGAWNHIAFIRSGNSIYVSINGVTGCSVEISGSLVVSTSPLASLGAYLTTLWPTFPGYIDEFRISNIARTFIDKPLNLITNSGDSQVTLSWDVVTSATGYKIKRSLVSGGPYTTLVDNVTKTSYIDTTVTNGVTYYYVITALNDYGESVNSNEASATPEGCNLLRITMNDSSEREYKVNTTEFNSFLAWFNRTIGTGVSYYSFDKTIGTLSSTEYLAFDKIISFKTMTVGSQVILKIIMSDSSEREYAISSADAFISWHGRMVSPCTTGTMDYKFTDAVDGSMEYLAFEQIISFEVSPIA